jgi:DNA-directed RNA polymerase specialized sigma subunit
MPYADRMTARKRYESDETVQMTLRALKQAYENAASAIDAAPSAQQAFDAATELANILRDLAEAAAEVRARAVARIWKTEELSLASLAQRIGVSKARADQLLKSAKASEGETMPKQPSRSDARPKTQPPNRGRG